MRSIIVGLALTGFIGVGLAVAKEDPIKERQELMETTGKAMGAVSAMMKGEKPYDATVAAASMKTIGTDIEKFITLFPAGSETGGKTRAKPEIWKNMKDFTDWGKQLKEDAGKAETVAAQGMDAFKPAFAAVGKSCGGCHDDYRAPKKD